MISPILPDHVLEKMNPSDRKRLGKAGVTMREAIEKAEVKSERDLQNLIANELLRRGIWFTRSAMNKRTTNTVGTPDFLFCVHGLFCAVEVKHAAGKLRIEQSLALSEIRVNGGRAVAVRGFQEFVQFLKEVET